MAAPLDPGPLAGSARRLTRAEFERSYTECAGLLWTLAAAVVGRRAEVEDVVQEACGIALGKLGEFEPGTSFSAWMASIVRFTALNHARAQRRRRGAEELEPERLWESPEIGADVPVDARGSLAADQHAFDDALARALATLAPLARACLLLRTVRELEYREIAALLSIPEGTAMSHVHRSRTALRALLSEGGRE